jgi:hypothetical protein
LNRPTFSISNRIADADPSLPITTCAGDLITQAKRCGFQVNPGAALIEMEPHAARFGCVYQGYVQVGAGNGINDLVLIFPVGLERNLALHRMHHASLHGHDDAAHLLP